MPLVIVVVALLILYAVRGAIVGKIPSNAARFMPAARREAERYEIDASIFCSLIDRESDWNPNAFRNEPQVDAEKNIPGLQPDKSYGLCQVLLRTARAYGYTGDADGLFDPDTNLHFGAIILSDAYKRRRTYEDALAEYNSGKGFAAAPEHTRTVYVPEILATAPAYEVALNDLPRDTGLA